MDIGKIEFTDQTFKPKSTVTILPKLSVKGMTDNADIVLQLESLSELLNAGDTASALEWIAAAVKLLKKKV